jgi:hypothetical protein
VVYDTTPDEDKTYLPQKIVLGFLPLAFECVYMYKPWAMSAGVITHGGFYQAEKVTVEIPS